MNNGKSLEMTKFVLKNTFVPSFFGNVPLDIEIKGVFD